MVTVFGVACSAGALDPGVQWGDELGTASDPNGVDSDGSDSDGDASDGEGDDDGSGSPGADEGSDGGGDEGGGPATSGGDGGQPLPDLDCDPQPDWYYPKDPIATGALEHRTWRWIAVPEMRCANDTTGGFFLNTSEQTRDLVIFFGGGGVCYDAVSCLLDTPLLLGMGPSPLLTWSGDQQSWSGIFARQDPINPFRDASYVFFPHCTGDGHTADKTSNYGSPIQQVGYRNVQEAMRLIAPTFASVERVTVAGFSAGGIGSLANYHQIAWLYECLDHPPPLLIDDAGPVLRKPFLNDIAQNSLRVGWGLDETFGELCPQCASEGYHSALQRIRELHPGVRSALVSAYSDNVVRQLYSALTLDFNYANNPDSLRPALLDHAGWAASLPDPTPQTRHRSFFYPGDRHGALVVAPLSDTPGLAEFLQAQLDDAPGWSNVTP